jgi:hypothetical protein
VIRIANELENIPLGDTKMFDKVPRGVRNVGRFLVNGRWWEIGHGFVKGQMGVSAT